MHAVFFAVLKEVLALVQVFRSFCFSKIVFPLQLSETNSNSPSTTGSIIAHSYTEQSVNIIIISSGKLSLRARVSLVEQDCRPGFWCARRITVYLLSEGFLFHQIFCLLSECELLT